MSRVQKKPLISCVCVTGNARRGAPRACCFHRWWHPGLRPGAYRTAPTERDALESGRALVKITKQFTSHPTCSGPTNTWQQHGAHHDQTPQAREADIWLILESSKAGLEQMVGGFIHHFRPPSIFKLCHSPHPPAKGYHPQNEHKNMDSLCLS